jgi:uncharacterized protein YjbI with pentapeptide repeats
MHRVDFEGTNLSGGLFEGADLKRGNFRKACFRGINIVGCDLSLAVFEEAILSGGIFCRVKSIDKADFTAADLTGANFSQVVAKSVSFRHARLENAVFESSDFSHCDFSKASLTGAKFSVARCGQCLFVNTSCVTTKFLKTDLNYSDFSYADLSKAVFLGSNLDKANLHAVNDTGADWRGAYVATARYTDRDRLAAEAWRPGAA